MTRQARNRSTMTSDAQPPHSGARNGDPTGHGHRPGGLQPLRRCLELLQPRPGAIGTRRSPRESKPARRDRHHRRGATPGSRRLLRDRDPVISRRGCEGQAWAAGASKQIMDQTACRVSLAGEGLWLSGFRSCWRAELARHSAKACFKRLEFLVKHIELARVGRLCSLGNGLSLSQAKTKLRAGFDPLGLS